MMKRIIPLLLMTALLLPACGGKKTDAQPAPAAQAPAETAAQAEAPAASAEAAPEVPAEAPAEEPAPEPVYGLDRFTGVWHEGGDPAAQTLVIRSDGKFIRINENDEYDMDGELVEGEEEIGGAALRTVSFVDGFGDFYDMFYDDGEEAPVSFRFGNGDATPYEKEDLALSELPVPAFFYDGMNPCMGLIIDYLAENCAPLYKEGDVFIPAPVVHHTDDSDPADVKYIGNYWTFLYDLYGRELVSVSGGEMPACFHFDTTGDAPVITAVDRVRDGVEYVRDIHKMCEKYEGLEDKFYDRETDDAVRLSFVEMYVEESGLEIDAIRDFGWPRIELTGAAPAPAATVGMPDPWTDAEDLQEASEGSGIDFLPPVEEALPGNPEKVKLTGFRYMPGTIEALYENAEDVLIIRASLDRTGFDLAGDYSVYTKEWEENFKGLSVTCRGDGEKANVAVFDDGEVYFSVTCNPGREGAGLTADQLKSIIMGEQASGK